jgi:hypothetical protein
VRKTDAKRLYKLIEQHCNDSEDYGANQLQVSIKETLDGGIKPLNTKDVKAWFLNVCVIGHFIDAVLFKSNLCVNSDNLTTFGRGHIPTKLVPKAFKIKLSDNDKNELYMLHCEIKERTKEVRGFIHTYPGSNDITCGVHNITSFSCYAMEIPQKFYDICH